ncbi:hypothetical protein BM523_02440 [Alteromonas mediterranea]|uniref:DUF4760 domain-containing protein n=1 Tax=Alteromonas mediterranea TaxID=314275 RepID=UPI0009042F7F|nr:hypothetical protein [Alteromonas mediterranea]APD92954.1 hypothetical protein BM523_02440 [Alteromonas mediterranea]APD96568.1 hypothetical protein BM525_02425 [Alteromonas mediterranea]
MESINEFIFNLRPIFELLYFISGLVVAAAAIYALKQIPLLKRTLRIQSKRDALKITSEQCDIYMSEIIPMQNVFHEAVKENKVTYFQGWDVSIENDELKVSRKTPPNMKGFSSILKTLNVLNKMESFSSYFTSNVADEVIAYHTVGTTFLSFTKELLPWVISCREDGYYKNLTKLYIHWESRRLNEQLMKQKLDLEKRLNNTSLSSNKVPLGAENT